MRTWQGAIGAHDARYRARSKFILPSQPAKAPHLLYVDACSLAPHMHSLIHTTALPDLVRVLTRQACTWRSWRASRHCARDTARPRLESANFSSARSGEQPERARTEQLRRAARHGLLISRGCARMLMPRARQRRASPCAHVKASVGRSVPGGSSARGPWRGSQWSDGNSPIGTRSALAAQRYALLLFPTT